MKRATENIKNVGKDERKNIKRMDWTHEFKMHLG